MKIEILGTEYEIIKDEELEEMDGCCDKTVKKINICKTLQTQPESKNSVKDIKWQADKVLRHEIIHAFMFEGGLAENHDRIHNEQVVDWIALMYPKMKKVFDQLEI